MNTKCLKMSNILQNFAWMKWITTVDEEKNVLTSNPKEKQSDFRSTVWSPESESKIKIRSNTLQACCTFANHSLSMPVAKIALKNPFVYFDYSQKNHLTLLKSPSLLTNKRNKMLGTWWKNKNAKQTQTKHQTKSNCNDKTNNKSCTNRSN